MVTGNKSRNSQLLHAARTPVLPARHLPVLLYQTPYPSKNKPAKQILRRCHFVGTCHHLSRPRNTEHPRAVQTIVFSVHCVEPYISVFILACFAIRVRRYQLTRRALR